MRPAFLDEMSWEMAEVYGAITDQILINLAHYFPYWKPGQAVPKSSFEYQANMLAQMGKVNRQTARIIAQGLGGADTALGKVIQQAIIESVSKAQPELLQAVKRGILQPPGQVIVTPNQTRAFQLYYQQAAQKLNLVNTVMLESTSQAYQSTVADIAARMQATQTALDVGAGETITGVSSWNTAMRHSIDRMKENGITGFIDHAGRRWSAEAYAAMDIRTTVANTARAAVWETNQSFGNDLYQVSYHDGARPLCYPWQNQVISSTNNARTVTDLDGNEIRVYAQSETSYGEAAGLFGINCKHYPSPFIPGVSIIRGQPQDEEANARTYAQSQEQRRLERKLRGDKRDLMMAKAQGAPREEIDRLEARCRQSSADIQDFCDSTGRARHRDREGVYTERKFPAADTYDVAAFERKQQQAIGQFYAGGGEQQGYTFGQMQTAATQAGATNGIYTIKDATVTKEQNRVVNPGTSSEIVLKNATVYSMPDGVQFVFKSGMIKEHQRLTPEQLIGEYYKVPKVVREQGQKVINVVDRYNPNDAYWRKVYKDVGFENSYATGGRQMTFYRYDYEHEMDYVLFTFEHEAGHLIDANNGRISATEEWAEAMRLDKLASGKDNWRTYSGASKSEDFADAVGYYFTEGKKFRETFPNRAQILSRLFGGAK